MDDAVQFPSRAIGRPSGVAAFRERIEKILEQEPRLKTVEILSRLRNYGYGGAKSPVYDWVAKVRPRPVEPVMVRFEGVAGEFSQHDFGQVDLRYQNGRRERIHFFATRMKYSRWTEVSLVPNEQVEPLVRAMVSHFASIGGIPLLAVFDRPTTIAKKWSSDGKVTQWNPTFAAVAMELGLGVELCWPASPRQKGSVENLVGWVKNSFFRQRRFVDREDFECQLGQWHEEVNTQRASRATGQIPLERMEAERSRLRPLKVQPAELALRIPVRVGPTAMVGYGGQMYSMPADTISMSATLMLYQDRVRIVAGGHDVLHPRLHLPGQKSQLPEHRAQAIATVSGRRGRSYYKREQLFDLGEVAVDYITELVHRRPRTWYEDIDSLYRLLELHGQQAMCYALAQGLEREVIGAEYIAHFLCEQAVAHYVQGEFLS